MIQLQCEQKTSVNFLG